MNAKAHVGAVLAIVAGPKLAPACRPWLFINARRNRKTSEHSSDDESFTELPGATCANSTKSI